MIGMPSYQTPKFIQACGGVRFGEHFDSTPSTFTINVTNALSSITMVPEKRRRIGDFYISLKELNLQLHD